MSNPSWKFDIEDMRRYADRYRGKDVMGGPYWPMVFRFPILFDEYEKQVKQVKLSRQMEKTGNAANCIIRELRDTIVSFDDKGIFKDTLDAIDQFLSGDDPFSGVYDEKKELERQVSIMREALEWYADFHNYNEDFAPVVPHKNSKFFDVDFGHHAKMALRLSGKIKDMSKQEGRTDD